MGALGSNASLRACTEADDAFVYEVFCTTWATEVAALPNQNLARHVLRIQHIAQERRFAARYPQHQRYLVLEDGAPAGRFYVHETASMIRVVDLTLMPAYRDRGIGTRILHDLLRHAEAAGQSITLRVERRNERATMLYSSLGFDLVTVDDLDNHFEWHPASVTKGGATASAKEDPVGLVRDQTLA